MNRKPILTEQAALAAYLILTPLISLTIALLLPLPTVLIALLLVLIPPSMAILLTALIEGGNGVTGLLKKLFEWRVSLKWYAVALLMPAGIILVSAVLAFLVGWAPAVQFSIPERSLLIINSVVALLAGALEEFGWRGYALPRLLAHRSPLSSALLIGIPWGTLHIGIGLSADRPWLPTFLIIFPLSIILTWLFIHTRGSLAMAMLFHFALDAFPQFLLLELPIGQAVWAQTIVNLVVALGLILLFGAEPRRNPARKMEVVDAVGR